MSRFVAKMVTIKSRQVEMVLVPIVPILLHVRNYADLDV